MALYMFEDLHPRIITKVFEASKEMHFSFWNKVNKGDNGGKSCLRNTLGTNHIEMYCQRKSTFMEKKKKHNRKPMENRGVRRVTVYDFVLETLLQL